MSTRDFALPSPYTPPGSSATNFELAGAVPQNITGVTAGDQALFGTPTLVNESTLENVSAGDQSLFGTPTVIQDQFIRPSGFDATAFGGLQLVFVKYIVGQGFSATQFGTTTVYNFDQYVQIRGFDSAVVWDDYGPVDVVAPLNGSAKIYVLDGTHDIGAGDMSSFGAPTVSHV